ncbi:hypothetical protein RHMOL_Rhmol06G0133000 [Rhododendron molle]|uniref:Uncharacterized protein n=1 Tax=Rhododendron molle TaxID=49168 RepID=A0ACC0NDS0_RHOML|nr:hypothetical protein RHMOL_Rhmol06G0133000 [Rhododendron molle]
MKQSLVSAARRALSLHATTPSSNWRIFCSSPSSPSNNKLFVGGLSLSLSLYNTCNQSNDNCTVAFDGDGRRWEFRRRRAVVWLG